MATSKTGDSFDDYMKKRSNTIPTLFSRNNLVAISDVDAKVNDDTITKLISEGNKLIAEEAKLKSNKKGKDESKNLEIKLGKSSKNPYVRARAEILEGMDSSSRIIIEKMERGALPKDSRFTEFCKSVERRGDQLSSNN